MLIVLSRLNRIIDVDIPNQRVTVEPGVINLDVTRRVAPHGYYYAPDPSSQLICSIGGNIAENSGGAHCLKYGFTVHHVLGVEAVLPNGEMVHLGGAGARRARPRSARRARGIGRHAGGRHESDAADSARARGGEDDSRGLRSTDAAGAAVSEIIAAGIIPAAVEMMDRLTIEAAEAAVHPNFPKADAVLIVELDGAQSEVDGLFADGRSHLPAARAAPRSRSRGTTTQRARIWKGRKAAFAAMGRVSPNYYVQDGVDSAHEAAGGARRASARSKQRSGLRIGNVFHAGDGNLHPLICYDEQIPGQGELAEKVASEILMYCIEAGGSITGEHGVGADKSA